MKNFTLLIALWFCLYGTVSFAQNVGISPSGSAPDASAGLDVNFTDKGLLIPRVDLVSTTSASPVATPATSLLVYNTATTGDVTPGYYFWNGTAWTRLGASLQGSGTANYLPRWSGTDALESSQVYDDGTNVGIGTATPGAKLDVAGRITQSGTGYSVFLGEGAGANDDLGFRMNVFIGYFTGNQNVTGYNNIAIGKMSLYSNSAGNENISIGSHALQSNQNGTGNTANGSVTLHSNTSGNNNTANGTAALYSNSTGSYNTAIGDWTLFSNVNGYFNSAFGSAANVATGDLTNATAIGANAFVRSSNSLVLGSIADTNGATASVNVGIGTTTPSARLDIVGNIKITDGTQGANKVLTSDADGFASWQESELAELANYEILPGCYTLKSTVTTSNWPPTSIAISGHYAYFTTIADNVMYIYDVSDPANPIFTGSVSTGFTPYSVAVSGNYAYVANYGSHTLTVYNVTDPSNPAATGSVITGGHPASVAVSGNFAYVANNSSNTMTVYNVSNPASPTYTGLVNTGNYPNSVAISGIYAYVANSASNSLTIYNVSEPSNPTLTGSLNTGNWPTSVVVSGNYAYVTNAGSNTLTIINVSNPAYPTLTGTTATDNPSSVVVQGNYAYVTNYNSNTMTIYDVSIPSSPSQLGSISTGNSPKSIAVSGTHAYVVNYNGGSVQIFKIACNQNVSFQEGNVLLVPETWSTSSGDIYNANSGNVGIGTASPTAKLDVAGGNIRTNQQLVSTVVTGTAPIIVSSTTSVSNLNADLLDGSHASAFATSGHSHTLTLTGDLTGSGNVTGSWSTTLANSGVSAGTFGSTGANVPSITVDAKGRITSAANRALTPANIGAWSITGNSATVAGTNFVGTTDNNAFDIRTNNLLRTRITTKGAIETYNTGYSVFLGQGAGASDDLSNKFNVCVGYFAGYTNVSGMYNTAAGSNSLKNNTVSSNTAFGYSALENSSTGNFNTATGAFAMQSNSTGTTNSAFGLRALNANVGGSSNTACGAFAMEYANAGSYNTAVGANSLNSNLTSQYNTAIGYNALKWTTGGNNTACGSSALTTNTTGSYNTAIGNYADVASNALTNATAIGAFARVGASNSLVLGSIAGINGATETVKVGIGTTTPSAMLDVVGGSVKTDNQLISTVAAGTAPLSVTSSTLVTNLNADLLDGLHAGNADGQIPISNSTLNTNLNADLLDGLHSDGFILNQTATQQAAGFRINGDGIFNGGKIGIGTTNPIGDLHIESTGDVTIVLNADTDNAGGEEDNPRIEMRQDGGGVVGALGLAGSANVIHAGDLVNALYLVHEWDNALQFGTNNEIKMTILPNGYVGIGTNAPKAPLHVATATSTTPFTSQSVNYTKITPAGGVAANQNGGLNAVNVLVSMVAEGDIVCKGTLTVANAIYLSSDKRLKDISGISNSLKDLEILKKIQVTDYTMKDRVTWGFASYKKAIAQQVEEVYPQAITKTTGYIPDVYEFATKVEKTDEGFLVTMGKPVNCKAGDKIRFEIENKGTVEADIISVINDKQFEVIAETDISTGELFVYGLQVDDLRTVDYDAISMLNVSATQELARQLQEAKDRIEELQNQNQELKAQIGEIRQYLEMKANR